jgi:hypothetical protein
MSKEMAILGDWVVIAKLQGIEHIYPRTKPPILEVGFSRQGELCEHFLFGNRKTEHGRKRTEMTDVVLLLWTLPIPWQPRTVLYSPVL